MVFTYDLMGYLRDSKLARQNQEFTKLKGVIGFLPIVAIHKFCCASKLSSLLVIYSFPEPSIPEIAASRAFCFVNEVY